MLLKLFYTILLLSIVALPQMALSQEKTFKMVEYEVADGMASPEVYQAIQSKSGEIWFASNGGISTFNGYEFKNYTGADGLVESTIFRLYEDNWGRVWYMSYQSGIGYFLKEKNYSYPYNDSIKKYLGNRYVLDMVIDSLGSVWLSGHRHGMVKIDLFGNCMPDVLGAPNSNQIIRKKIGEDLLNGVLCGENNDPGFFLSDEKKGIFNFRIIDEDIRIMRKFLMNEDAIYIGYFNQLDSLPGIARIKDTLIETRTTERVTNDLFIDSHGKFWVCQQFLGIRIYGSEDDFFKGAESQLQILEGKNVSNILADNQGGLWVSVQNQGVIFIPNQEVINITSDENKKTEAVSSLTLNDKGELYYVTVGGELYKIDRNNEITCEDQFKVGVSQISYQSTLEKIEVLYSIDTWLKNPKGILDYKPDKYLTLKGRDALIRENGEVLILVSDGVRRVVPDGSKSSFGNGRFYAVHEDINGKTWIGGKQGLFTLEAEEKLVPVHFNNLENNIGIVSLIEQFDAHTLVLFVVGQGVFFIDIATQPKIKKIIRFDSYVNKMHVDDDGDLWLASEKGAILIHLVSWHAYQKYHMTENQGLASNKINDIVLYRDTVYVATDEGLSIFPKSILMTPKTPPKLKINTLFVNEEKVPLETALHFEHTENTVEFFFTGISYNSSRQIKYGYFLNGVDSELNYSTGRSVRYPNLPPGSYEFMVKAANENGDWSEFEKVAFQIDLPYWKKWWFILLLAFSGLLMLFIYINSRERRIKREEQNLKMIEMHKRKSVESELKALRSQMNPHFIFNTLNSIQGYIMTAQPEEAADYITKFAHLMRRVLENSKRSSVPIQEELYALELYLDLQNIRFEDPIHVTFDIEENIKKENPMIPSMILQPVIENSILHGLAPKTIGQRSLEIRLKMKRNRLFCTIIDNGVGRAQAEKMKKAKGIDFQQSSGLKMTRDRLEMYFSDKKGQVTFRIEDLTDSEGQGSGTKTEICFIT